MQILVKRSGIFSGNVTGGTVYPQYDIVDIQFASDRSRITMDATFLEPPEEPPAASPVVAAYMRPWGTW